MELLCPVCSSALSDAPSGDDKWWVKCPGCGAESVDFGRIPEDPAEKSAPDPGSSKAVTVEDREEALFIGRKSSPGGWVLVLLILGSLFGIITLRDLLQGGWGVGGLLLLLVTSPLIYYCLLGIFNSTVIRIDTVSLSIFHAPLWWPGKRTLQSSGIQGIYCLRHRDKIEGQGWSHPFYHYSVSLVMSGGRHVRILKELEGEKEAFFIARTIESRLGITSRWNPL